MHAGVHDPGSPSLVLDDRLERCQVHEIFVTRSKEILTINGREKGPSQPLTDRMWAGVGTQRK